MTWMVVALAPIHSMRAVMNNNSLCFIIGNDLQFYRFVDCFKIVYWLQCDCPNTRTYLVSITSQHRRPLVRPKY